MARKLSFRSYLIILASPVVLFLFFNFFVGRGNLHHYWGAQIAAMRPARAIDNDLIEAVKIDDMPSVRALIAKGADINSRDRTRYHHCLGENVPYETPLMLAIVPRRKVPAMAVRVAPVTNENLVRFLVANGADVNARDSSGRTALLRAARVRNVAVCNLLIDRGAEINARSNDGSTPLSEACSAGNTPVVRKLIEAGASINEAHGSPALAEAVYRGHKELVLLLLEHGAKVNMPGGYSPLHQCMFTHREEFAKLLIDHGADVNAKILPGGETPMHQAALYGMPETIELLLRHGADATSKTAQGQTPLDIARRYGIANRGFIKDPVRFKEYKRRLVETRLKMTKILENAAGTRKD